MKDKLIYQGSVTVLVSLDDEARASLKPSVRQYSPSLESIEDYERRVMTDMKIAISKAMKWVEGELYGA